MSKELSKSPEMLRREAEIKSLRKRLQKKQTTLKSLKTRLRNMQKDIDDIHRKAHTHITGFMERLDKLRLEIVDLATRVKKVKGIPKEDREALSKIGSDFSSSSLFGEEFEEYQEERAKMEAGEFNFEEEQRAKMWDLFQQFQVQPEEKEQRDIRKVFLKLSNKFHPDRAKNEKEAAAFHERMQEINAAYQRNDIQALLEMEQLHLMEVVDFSAEAATIDVLQQEINRLKKSLRFIENQIGRTSREVKNLRQSDFGQMLTDVKRAERQGVGFEEMTAQYEELIRMLTLLRDGLKDSIKKGKVSPLIEEFYEQATFGGFMPNLEDMDQEDSEAVLDMLAELMGVDGEEDDLFDPFGFAEMEEVEDPKFPVGSSVVVTWPLPSPFMKKIKMKGWVGRVEFVQLDYKGRTVYDVSFDSLTMDQMPDQLIKKAVEQVEDFQTVELFEHQLEAALPRDTEEEAIASYRKHFHRFTWNYLKDDKKRLRLQKILFQYPDKPDFENWTSYLDKHLRFPFEAQTRAMFDGYRSGLKATVTGMEGYDEEYGHIVSMKLKGKNMEEEYPLAALKSLRDSGRLYEILDDYYVWAEEMQVFDENEF